MPIQCEKCIGYPVVEEMGLNPVSRCPVWFTLTAILAAKLPTLLSEPLLGSLHGTFGASEEIGYEDWGRRGPGHDL